MDMNETIRLLPRTGIYAPQRRSRDLWAWAVAGIILLGCLAVLNAVLSGCSAAPSPLERRLYSVSTSAVPVSVTATLGTNGVEYQTNYGTAYALAPSAAVQQALALGGYFGPTGELVAGLVLAALLGWAQYRNRKQQAMAKVLVQNIAAGRSALQETSEGRAIDERWRQEMIFEQSRAGVLREVTELVRNYGGSAVAGLTPRPVLTRH